MNINLIRKNFKSINVLKIGAYSFIAIPLFMFVMRFLGHESLDRFVYTGLILITVSIFIQFMMNFIKKIESKNFQYLYILIVMNITMFLSYVLKYNTDWITSVEDVGFKGFGKLLASIVISTLLFVIKTTTGILLMFKGKRMKQSDDNKVILEEKYSSLKDEHAHLEQKFENLNKKLDDDKLKTISENKNIVDKPKNISSINKEDSNIVDKPKNTSSINKEDSNIVDKPKNISSINKEDSNVVDKIKNTSSINKEDSNVVDKTKNTSSIDKEENDNKI